MFWVQKVLYNNNNFYDAVVVKGWMLVKRWMLTGIIVGKRKLRVGRLQRIMYL